ncbi:hypothetical protein [Variovorax sp. dw_308]|uniref:hypothetical protein n=1 Tax=Variovorax sp. dw_308 TaxID=2721546 RepID=UPI001C464B0A|nr:hypothetical protein [Variovorax sp. dw_308]
MSMQLLDRLLFANHFMQRIAHKAAFAAAMVLCIAWCAATAVHAPAAPAVAQPATSTAWPDTWDGARLRPLALSEVEQRFAEHFPGDIARMTDGAQTLVLREVRTPTRMLHPAADCYRALGYRIDEARLERDPRERLWRCFLADRPGTPRLRVCERIVDAAGAAFTDTSAWYWAAASGKSTGPWQAITTARVVE